MNVCSICNSEFRSYIDNCLIRRVSVKEIIKELKLKHNVSFSRSAIYRHRKNHLMLPKRNPLYRILMRSGNYKLIKAIEKTERILKEYPECICDKYSIEEIKRRGRVWIHPQCQGWIRYDIGLAIRKRIALKKPKYTKLMASARSYRRSW